MIPTFFHVRYFVLNSANKSHYLARHIRCLRSAVFTRFFSDITKIRNVGILAHIDAGKTTTTERMLYLSGYINHVGNVDRGDTVMDFMQQERDRGITISSAAITFPWRDHQINLIDTPGHVDFTLEVERSLLVLDGAILVLDGAAGVQAQTINVWRQAKRKSVPMIAFINKMDKSNASLEFSLDSISKKLGVTPLKTRLRIEDENFDLVDISKLSDDLSSDIRSQILSAREALIDHLCESDSCLTDVLMKVDNYTDIMSGDILRSLRKLVVEGHDNYLVVLSGSSFRNSGVEALMDALVNFLPSPADKSYAFLHHFKSDAFVGMAFKVFYHVHKGPLVFVRIYRGILHQGQTLYNVNRSKSIKITELMVAFAEEFKPVSSVNSGCIAVISNCRHETSLVTGDTLVSNNTETISGLAGISVPDPVFFASIEAPSIGAQKQLDFALFRLAREDPSLRIKTDENTGQTVLAGMGELHLEIILDRIQKEYKVNAELGRLLIAYKETILESAEVSFDFERKIGAKIHHVYLKLAVSPHSYSSKTLDICCPIDLIKPSHIKAMNRGIESVLQTGPLLGFPVTDVSFTMHEVSVERGTLDSMVMAATLEAAKSALQKALLKLTEPWMKLDITLLEDDDEDNLVSKISHDLMMRRRAMEFESFPSHSGTFLLKAIAPLAELRGYATCLRSLSSGRAILGMELSHYVVINDDIVYRKAIEDVTGFSPVL